MKRSWWLAAILGVSVAGLGGGAIAAPKAKDSKETKEAPLKANPALKPKIEKRIAPFKIGMTSDEVFKVIEKQIDEEYAEKIAKAYNPKTQTQLEKEADKKKKALRGKLFEFKGGAGVSGYEVKAPGEFTYKNNESALEVPRPGGGERQLFFLNDRLWKVYDHVHLTGKDAELGETWDHATEKLGAALGEKGKKIAAKTASPSYYGVMLEVPEHLLWTDGAIQVRLVDHTKREDMTARTVGIAYEELATVEKLSVYRTNVEKKASDAMVDKAGYEPVKADVKDDKAKPKKKK